MRKRWMLRPVVRCEAGADMRGSSTMTGGDGGGGWRKSSASGTGNCVEVWTKAEASGGNGCVQVRRDGTSVWVRDSKLGDDSPVLAFTPAEWVAFLAGVRDGEFDLP